MSDIVERLRKLWPAEDGYTDRLAAAYEITRLRERVAELEGALKFYCCNCQPGQCENGPVESNIDTVSCGHRARAALTQGEKL